MATCFSALPPTTPCTSHRGADRKLFGCVGPDPDSPDPDSTACATCGYSEPHHFGGVGVCGYADCGCDGPTRRPAGALDDLVTFVQLLAERRARMSEPWPFDDVHVRAELRPYVERLYAEWERGLLDAARLRREAFNSTDRSN